MRILPLLLLCACSSPAAETDAGPDARPIPDGTPPGVLPGDYAVTWECLEVCTGSPFFVNYIELRLADDWTATLSYEGAPEEEEITDTCSEAGPCLSCAGLEIDGVSPTEPYTVCSPEPGLLHAEVAWTGPPGPSVRTVWALEGARL